MITQDLARDGTGNRGNHARSPYLTRALAIRSYWLTRRTLLRMGARLASP